jgi:acetyl esterase/lipase
MPSFQSRLNRLVIQYYVTPKFRRAGKSVPAWKKLMDDMNIFQRPPKGTQIQPVMIGNMPAEWVWSPGSEEQLAVLYLHGGGMVMGTPANSHAMAARLSAGIGCKFLLPVYRLAPEHPFPAAVEDVISAYRWLLEQGYSPEHLVMGGESAGGSLAVQALLALRDTGEPLPAAGFCMSPPLDWTRFDGESYRTRAQADPWITEEMCRFTGGLYVGDNDPATPLLNPLDMDLAGLPPLLIHVGDDEVLLSDSVRLAERARAAGVHVEFKIWPGMWHVFQSGTATMPEAHQSLAEISRFVSTQLRAAVPV